MCSFQKRFSVISTKVYENDSFFIISANQKVHQVLSYIHSWFQILIHNEMYLLVCLTLPCGTPLAAVIGRTGLAATAVAAATPPTAAALGAFSAKKSNRSSRKLLSWKPLKMKTSHYCNPYTAQSKISLQTFQLQIFFKKSILSYEKKVLKIIIYGANYSILPITRC